MVGLGAEEYIREVAAAALAGDPLRVVEELFFPQRPEIEGPWAVVRTPHREDKNPSLKVHLDDGGWTDFGGAADDCGQDLVALWAWVRQVEQLPAARQLARFIGHRDFEPPREPAKRSASGGGRSIGEPIFPVPEDAPALDRCLVDGSYGEHVGWGRAQRWWWYTDAEGRRVYAVVRWDLDPDHPDHGKEHGKVYRPLSCHRSAKGKLAWGRKAPPAGERPLYRLHDLASRTDALVLVVEGEKAADVAAKLLPAWCVTTSHHGAKGAKGHDWSPLEGRRVVIWPDADEPDDRGQVTGQAYAAAAADLMDAAEVRMVDLAQISAWWSDGQVPAKWDLADELPAGVDLAAWLGDPSHLVDPPPPPKKKRRRSRPPPGPELGGDAVPDGDGRRHYGADHVALISGIETFLKREKIWADAANSWRSLQTDEILDVGAESLLNRFLCWYWRTTPVGAGIADRTMKALVYEMRQRRRQKIIDDLVSPPADPEAFPLVEAFVEAVTGQCSNLDCAVVRHTIWQVKRRAMGRRVEHDLMVACTGREQGSGKSTAMEKFCSPVAELAIPIRASTLTDDRNVPALSRSLIGVWDEMEGATKANLEALKFTITANYITYRPMGTNDMVRIQRRMTLLASSNYGLESLIRDPTGNRRSHELKAAPRCDWDVINGLDYDAMWRCVSADDPAPILPYLDQLRQAQQAIAYTDIYQRWIDWERWDSIEVPTGAVTYEGKVDTWEIPAYRDQVFPADHPKSGIFYGYTWPELSARFQHFANRVGHREPNLVDRLSQRIPQLGFMRHRPQVDGRRERRYLLPDELEHQLVQESTPSPDDAGAGEEGVEHACSPEP